MPKVSIIMPTYNVEKYFRECLDSIVNQTLEDIEIIPVDDGSPDNCGAIMDEYAAKDKRVKPIHQKNGGYGSAVNNGIAAATGEYIGIVETDDFCDLQMFEKLYNKAKNFDADVCKCGFNTYNSRTEGIKVRKWKNWLEDIESFPDNKTCTIKELAGLMNFHASIWSNIYKREFLLENNIKVNSTQGASYQDYPFMVEVMCRAKKIVILPEYLYYWRLEPSQNSSTKHTGKKCMIMASQCERVKELIKNFGYYNLFKEYMYTQIFHANLAFLINIDDEYKQEYFSKVNHLFAELKNDKTFKGEFFDRRERKYVKYIIDNDFNGFFGYYKRLTTHSLNFVQKIFSLTNNGTHKVVSILGFKLKFRNKVKIKNLDEAIRQNNEKLDYIIWQIEMLEKKSKIINAEINEKLNKLSSIARTE